jgi:hypothetical protein
MRAAQPFQFDVTRTDEHARIEAALDELAEQRRDEDLAAGAFPATREAMMTFVPHQSWL